MRLNLAGVGGADSVERAGERDSALDVADLPEKLQAIGPVKRGVEPNLRQRDGGKEALETEVMDGKESLGSKEHRVSGIGASEIGGNQTGLPIVAVQDVAAEEMAGYAEGRAAENSEADVIIRIVHAR